jgi:DNA topoisomerase-6 subunit B
MATKKPKKKSAKGAGARSSRGTRKTNARASGSAGQKRTSGGKPAAALEGLPLFEHTEEPREVPAAPPKRTAPAGAASVVEPGAASVVEPGAADLPLDAGEEEAPAARKRKGKKGYETAETIGRRQREISISEFFAKNRHLLGFDSLPKALVTAVKEAVDNSLDACEEAGILPDLLVEIAEIAENRYRVVIGDSGPGIVKAQVPKIFGKLLYGSKFHVLKQARGQQGIGISAAVMYSQLTTGKPARVITRTAPKQPAHVYELQIHTKTNTPVIVSEGTLEWERPHGTQVEIELLATYKKGQRSVDEYLHQVAMANPHARIVYRAPKDPELVYERLTNRLPVEAKAIRPHPHGIELGVLLDMLKVTHARNIKGFLEHEFSRMSAKTSLEVLASVKLAPSTSPKKITREQGDDLIRAFGAAKIMKPPTDCLSPIGEELLLHSVKRETDPEFFTAVTRPPAVYRGNPFQIEAAIAYGGPMLPADEIVRLYRFANRAPLVYQQSACAMTNSVMNTAWKSYGVAQSKGALPAGPLLIVVHIASAWVPFTSESKEAIAHYPEIIKEIKLALQECGRQLNRFIRRGAKAKEEAKKRSYIEQYIPHIGVALKEILALSEKEEDRVVDTLRDTLEKSRSF